jgi:polyisoprenoid-binding protein YceI
MMMKSLWQGVVLLLLASCASAGLAQQALVPAQSDIAFTSRQMGVPVDGRFKKFGAQIAFDPKKPEASKIAFTIDLGSVSLGAVEAETELAKSDWFNTKAFPQAFFPERRNQGRRPRQVRGGRQADHQGQQPGCGGAGQPGSGQRRHHGQRRFCHQAARLQDWRR